MQGAIQSNGQTGLAWVVPALIGATPLLMAIAPLSFSPNPDNWQVFVRGNSLVIPLVEFAIVLIAMGAGGSPIRALLALPQLAKIALPLWLALALFVSYQPGNDFVYATMGLFKLALLGLFALAMLDVVEHYGRDFQERLWRCIGIGVLVYLAILAGYILSNDLKGEQWVSNFPGFNNIRHVAFLGFVSFAAGLAGVAGRADHRRARWEAVLAAAMGVAGVGLALWTGSRGPILALFALTALCLAFRIGSRKALIIYAGIAFVGAAAVVSLLPTPHPIYGIWAALGLTEVNAPSLDHVSSGRIEIWTGTVQKILEKPLFGWGIEQYSRFNPVGAGQLYHPHNFPLQILFAAGSVGLGLALCVVAPIAVRGSAWRGTAQNHFCAAVLAALLLYALYDGILYFSYPILICVTVFICCLRRSAAGTSD